MLGNGRGSLVAAGIAGEQSEAGRAAARHTHEFGSGPAAKPGEHLGNLRDQSDRWRFEIVAAVAPIAERPAVDAVLALKHVAGR